MAAYSALFSLIQSLEQILDPNDRYLNSILPYNSEITRLHEQASSLLALLEDSPSKFDHSLEGQIRRVTYEAQDIIESHMSDQILFGRMNRPGHWNCRSCQHLNFQRRDSCQRCGDPRPGDNFGGDGFGGGRSSFGFTGPGVRPGDWYCSLSNCGAYNFASRSTCFKCGGFKEEAGGGFDTDMSRSRGFGFGGGLGLGGGGRGSRSGWKSGDWICVRLGCNEHNFASRMECFRCNAPRESSTITSMFIAPSESSTITSMFDLRDHIPKLRHTVLRKLIDRFESVLAIVSRIKDGNVFVEDTRVKEFASTSSSRYESSNKITLVEIEEDVLKIKGLLIRPHTRLGIISIVGVGGIGKTTLARCIYNDPLIQEYFHIHAWTIVSYQYSLRKMLIDLLGSIGHFSVELGQESIDKLEVKLYQSLKGRKYLIVLDDIWSTNAWDDAIRFFPDDNNGSRIILTTRGLEVAEYAVSSYIHHMRALSFNGSWNLLSQKVFGETHCPPRLEEFGKEIANKCRGHPLAIVVLGGLLSRVEKTPEFWQYVAENTRLAITGIESDFMEILSLSYSHLPQHLKACFLYMGAFPEGREIHVSHLIKLWVAEGFTKPVGDKSLEEVAKENLKDIIDRSLVLVSRLSVDGEIKTCSIHDLLRDLCIRKAWEEDFLDINLRRVNQRRISFQFSPLEYPNHVTNSSIRSLLHFSVGYSSDGVIPFTMNLRLLRVLEALLVTFDELPIEIVEKLVNLKYLAFTCHERNIPPSISNLCNLQTLIVYGDLSPEHIFNLPSEIWELPQLRHIIFQRCILQFPSSADYVPLKNLQTLANVYNFRFTERVFRLMPNLKKLVISYIYDSHTIWSPYHFNHFVHLLQLETLKCYFIAKSIYAPGQLLNFAYPEGLKKLTLSGCTLPWTSLTVVGSLPNLEVLKLKDDAFVGSVWKTNEGEFPQLKYFLVASSSLEHWRTEETHFPRLRHLSLKSCSELGEIPSEIGNISTLEIIELFECSTSVVDSAHRIKEELQNNGNEDFRVLCS